MPAVDADRLLALTGLPVTGYCTSPEKLSSRISGEFGPCVPQHTPGSHLALPARCRMTYYSCVRSSGPRGIRTPGLLNAIETR
ncbi:MAG TPA: hypothetical protein PKG92_09485, partial [Anaerolineaceae bacterium]|nr:hypothetical protein [Anaerolineaceae bacterium]